MNVLSDVCGLFSITEKSPDEDSDDKTTSESQYGLNLSPNIDEWYSHASKIVFNEKDEDIEPASNGLCSGGGCTSVNSFESDNKAALLNMSLTAARIQHSLKNLKYDDTQSLNPINDIELVMSYIAIPIGSE